MLCSSSGSPGRSTWVFAAICWRSATFAPARPRVGQRLRAAHPAPPRRPCPSRPRRTTAWSARPVELDLPAQLAAGALAERAVVARRRRRAVGGADHGRVLRAAVVRSELMGRRRAAAGHEGGPVVAPKRWGQAACRSPEQQCALVVSPRVLEVERAGVRGGPAPRVGGHQLGVGVEGHRDGPRLWGW